MLGRKNTFIATTALVAGLALALAACEGDTGPQGPAGLDGIDGVDGNDGLGYVPMPTPDQALGEYAPLGDPADQTVDAKLGSRSGVWEIPLDGQVQIDFGNGTPPVVADTVVYDANFDELWLVVDGTEIPLTQGEGYESLACNSAGVPQPCVYYWVQIGGDYAELAGVWIEHGPAVGTQGYAHYGVKTAAADMPAVGTASYAGLSRLYAELVRPDGTIWHTWQTGDVTIEVDFGATVDQVAFSSTRGDLSLQYEHELSGLATIDGNSYSGTLSGTIIGVAVDDANTLVVDGTYSGTFYGPAADTYDPEALEPLIGETAGIFEASDTEPDLAGDPLVATSAVGEVIGGFVAAQDSYTPPAPE